MCMFALSYNCSHAISDAQSSQLNLVEKVSFNVPRKDGAYQSCTCVIHTMTVRMDLMRKTAANVRTLQLQ